MSDANTSFPVMKSISNALGMAPLILDEVAPVEEEEAEFHAPILAEAAELSKIDREAEEDFEVTRKNTKELLEKGQEALDGILRVASGTEHPRAFEVAANLLKTMADLNSGLLKLHEQRRQLVPVPEPEKTAATPGNVTNNNVFIGSTQELLDMLDERDRMAEQKGNVIEHDR